MGLQISTTPKSVLIQLNEYSDAYAHTRARFSKTFIVEIAQANDGQVVIELANKRIFSLSVDGVGKSMKVASVNQNIPTSNEELFDKLAILMEY